MKQRAPSNPPATTVLAISSVKRATTTRASETPASRLLSSLGLIANNISDQTRQARSTISHNYKDRVYLLPFRVIMTYPDFVNIQMAVDVNPKLRVWWNDIKWDPELEVDQLIGGLTSLLSVTPDPHLIRALLNF